MTQEIRTIAEIAALTPEQQAVFLKDLEEWLIIVNAHKDLSKSLPDGLVISMDYDVIHWVDDDRPGEISGMDISVRIDRSQPDQEAPQ